MGAMWGPAGVVLAVVAVPGIFIRLMVLLVRDADDGWLTPHRGWSETELADLQTGEQK